MYSSITDVRIRREYGTIQTQDRVSWNVYSDTVLSHISSLVLTEDKR